MSWKAYLANLTQSGSSVDTQELAREYEYVIPLIDTGKTLVLWKCWGNRYIPKNCLAWFGVCVPVLSVTFVQLFTISGTEQMESLTQLQSATFDVHCWHRFGRHDGQDLCTPRMFTFVCVFMSTVVGDSYGFYLFLFCQRHDGRSFSPGLGEVDGRKGEANAYPTGRRKGTKTEGETVGKSKAIGKGVILVFGCCLQIVLHSVCHNRSVDMLYTEFDMRKWFCRRKDKWR